MSAQNKEVDGFIKNHHEVFLLIMTALFTLITWSILKVFVDPIIIKEAIVDPETNKVINEAWTFSSSTFALWLMLAFTIFSYRWYNEGEDENGKPINGFVDTNEVAVRTRFGTATDTIEAGLPYVPLGIYKLKKLRINTLQYEFPGEPHEIDRTDTKDGYIIPKGKVAPHRTNFRNSISQSHAEEVFGGNNNELNVENPITGEIATFNADAPKDGLAERVIAEVVFVVRWRIIKDRATDFITNIHSVTEAKRQLEDDGFTVLERILTQISVGQAHVNRKWINAILAKHLSERTKDWGVHIESAYVKNINQNHSLNKSIAARAQSKFDKEARFTLADADRRERIRVGEGDAKAAELLEEKQLLGRTAGLVAMARDLGIDGTEAISNFVATEMAKGDNAVILGQAGFDQLTGIVAASLKNKGGSRND